MKAELSESGKKLDSLTAQVKELSNVNVQHEAEKESLKDEIANLTADRLKFHDENHQLKENLSDLCAENKLMPKLFIIYKWR